jgi:hypothetical protein
VSDPDELLSVYKELYHTIADLSPSPKAWKRKTQNSWEAKVESEMANISLFRTCLNDLRFAQLTAPLQWSGC